MADSMTCMFICLVAGLDGDRRVDLYLGDSVDQGARINEALADGNDGRRVRQTRDPDAVIRRHCDVSQVEFDTVPASSTDLDAEITGIVQGKQ